MLSSLGPLLLGDEVCAQGGSELPRVERAELPPSEALVVPRAEHSAHDGPRWAVDTEGRLPRKRGRELQGGWSKIWIGLDTLKDSIRLQISDCLLSTFSQVVCIMGWARAWSVYSCLTHNKHRFSLTSHLTLLSSPQCFYFGVFACVQVLGLWHVIVTTLQLQWALCRLFFFGHILKMEMKCKCLLTTLSLSEWPWKLCLWF